MYAMLMTVIVIGASPPQVVLMPFVQTTRECEVIRAKSPDIFKDGITQVRICYPLDTKDTETLRFSADTILRGIID
jgi:hypothetical protein